MFMKNCLLLGALLMGSIDASRLSEGTHQVELSLKLDEDHYAYQPITVSVTVNAKNTQDGDTSTDRHYTFRGWSRNYFLFL